QANPEFYLAKMESNWVCGALVNEFLSLRAKSARNKFYASRQLFSLNSLVESFRQNTEQQEEMEGSSYEPEPVSYDTATELIGFDITKVLENMKKLEGINNRRGTDACLKAYNELPQNEKEELKHYLYQCHSSSVSDFGNVVDLEQKRQEESPDETVQEKEKVKVKKAK
ncbi:MAG: hypothetical protein EBU90_31745, partial [Proteobacteria bacterium]|nr:hypothetical protein [Pseudomonadota bacterium]